MPQVRCETCDILQFHCPECGHHQPINTRRPAVQRAIARAGAWATGLLLLVKTNFFGWILFAWILFGYEWNRVANYRVLNPRAYGSYFDTEAVVLLMLLAAGFGAMGRMFVLRWRRGWVVGLVLAALTLSAAVGGMIWETSNGNLFPPGGDTPMMLAAIALAILAGAALAWPTWCALALMLLPKRTSARLLDWQKSLSDPAETRRSREPGAPV